MSPPCIPTGKKPSPAADPYYNSLHVVSGFRQVKIAGKSELEINEIRKKGEYAMRTHNNCCTEGFRLEIEAGTLTHEECVPTQKIAAPEIRQKIVHIT